MSAGTAAAAIALLVILGSLALLVRRGRAQEAHAEQGLHHVAEAEPLSPLDYRGHLPLHPIDEQTDGHEPGLVDAFREGLRDGVIEGLVDVEPGASERERRVAELVELLAVDPVVRRQVAVLIVAGLAAPGAGRGARGEAA